MKISKLDDKGYENRHLWPKGWYSCRIVAAGEGESKGGNAYFKLEVMVFRDGGSRDVSHIVMAEGSRAWTLRNACEAFGLMPAYESGEMNPRDFLDREAVAQVDIEKSKAYPARNVIVEFAAKVPDGGKLSRSGPMERSHG